MEIVLTEKRRLGVVRRWDGKGHYPVLVEFSDGERQWFKESEVEVVGASSQRKRRQLPAVWQNLPLDDPVAAS